MLGLILFFIGGVFAYPPYSVDTDLVNPELEPDENKTYTLWVHNNLDREISVNVSVAGPVERFIRVEKEQIIVGPNSVGESRIFVSPWKRGSFPGYLIIEGENRPHYLPLTLTVPEEEALLEIKLEAISKEIKKGDPVNFHVTLYNIGSKGEFMVNLTYRVKKGESIIAEEKEEIAIRTSVSLDRSINLDAGPGDYLIETEARYENMSAFASDFFKVKESRTKFLFLLMFLLLLLGVIIAKRLLGK
jgi:hypothetical protein